MNRLPAHCAQVVVPGNHDIPLYRIWERLFSPYRLFKKFISPHRNSVHRGEGLTVVGIDSTHFYRRLKGGKIRKKHLDFCADAFANSPESDFRVVVFHHPLFALTEEVNHDQVLVRSLRSMGVQLVLCGHVHESLIYHFPKEQGQPSMSVVLCGTSSSSRGRSSEEGANSLNVIRLTKEHVSISRRVYDSSYNSFGEVEQQSFPRA